MGTKNTTCNKGLTLTISKGRLLWKDLIRSGNIFLFCWFSLCWNQYNNRWGNYYQWRRHQYSIDWYRRRCRYCLYTCRKLICHFVSIWGYAEQKYSAFLLFFHVWMQPPTVVQWFNEPRIKGQGQRCWFMECSYVGTAQNLLQKEIQQRRQGDRSCGICKL